MSENQNPLRLNVGFVIHETVGYFRDFEFEFPALRLSPDFEVQDLTGSVRVTRTPPGLLVQVKMQASMPSECGRCLADFQQFLEIDFTELFSFSANSQTETDLIVPETGKIDLAPLVRDEMLLALPINPVCKPECQGLCPVCGESLNEIPHQHDDEPVDPRLSALKEFLEKKE